MLIIPIRSLRRFVGKYTLSRDVSCIYKVVAVVTKFDENIRSLPIVLKAIF